MAVAVRKTRDVDVPPELSISAMTPWRIVTHACRSAADSACTMCNVQPERPINSIEYSMQHAAWQAVPTNNT